MKSIKKVILTILSVGVLATTTTGFADTSSTRSDDGFLVLTIEDKSSANSNDAVIKQKHRKTRSVRAERKIRAKRAAAKKRMKRKLLSKKRRTYRVRSGDTLTKVAAKTGTNFSKLVRLNRLYGARKHHIYVGQHLRLR